MKKLNYQQLLTAAGMAILLGSWIVEHYWAAHWTNLKGKFELAQEELIQVEIHESVAVSMNQYTANIEPFNCELYTTGDVSILIESFEIHSKQVEAIRKIIGEDLAVQKTEDIRELIERFTVAAFPFELEYIDVKESDTKLTINQIRIFSDLARILNMWSKSITMFNAVDLLHETTLSRLERNTQNAKEIPGGEVYAKKFAELSEEIASGRDHFFKTGVLLEAGSEFVDKAKDLRIEYSSFLRDHEKALAENEIKYKGWHRIMYLLGSIILLVGISIPKRSKDDD